MKKVIAILCAGMLALSAPAAAFADATAELSKIVWTGNDSITTSLPRNESLTWNAGDGTFDAGTIKNLKITFAADTISPDAKDKTWNNIGRSLSENVAIPSSVQTKIKPLEYKTLYTNAFELKLRDADKNPTVGDKTIGLISPTGGTMSFDFAVSSGLKDEYSKEVASPNDLQYSLYAIATGGSTVETAATDKPIAQTTQVTVPTQTTIFVLLLTDASKKPPVTPTPDPVKPEPKPNTPVVNKKPSSSSSDSGSDSVAWRDLQVTGSPEVSAQGYLNGSNVSDADSAYLVVKRLTSGSAFNELRAAAGGDNLNKAFDVTLYADGKKVHSDFGRLRLSFDVGAQYNGKKATVWHLHDDGALTHEDTWVVDGNVTIEVTDLSEFGIDIEGVTTAETQADDGTTSPKTGQTVPAGTAAAALLVTGVLGATALLLTRRTR